jgi:hypothetical protein
VQALDRRFGKLADSWKEARERLARARRRHKQSASAAPRPIQHFQLVAARLPAFRFKPLPDDRR